MASFTQFLPLGGASQHRVWTFGGEEGDEKAVSSLPHADILLTQAIEMNSPAIRLQSCRSAAQAAKNNSVSAKD